MIPRYRGKLTGGKPKDYARRHRAAIIIELARFGLSIVLLYAAGVCALAVAFAIGDRFGQDLAALAERIPIVRQLAVQAAIIAEIKDYLPVIGLLASVIGLILIHLTANFLVDDLVDR